jgi:hypothetical protein
MADIAAENAERMEQEETKLLVDISSLDFKVVPGVHSGLRSYRAWSREIATIRADMMRFRNDHIPTADA